MDRFVYLILSHKVRAWATAQAMLVAPTWLRVACGRPKFVGEVLSGNERRRGVTHEAVSRAEGRQARGVIRAAAEAEATREEEGGAIRG
jgi:hypothetical protein